MSQQLERSDLHRAAVALRQAGKSRREIKEILQVGDSTLNVALRGCLRLEVRLGTDLYRQIEGWAFAAMAERPTADAELGQQSNQN
jgi:hypothetical protein